MKRMGYFVLMVLVIAWGCSPAVVMAHGEEKHGAPRKLQGAGDTPSPPPSGREVDQTTPPRDEDEDGPGSVSDSRENQSDTVPTGDRMKKQKRQVRGTVRDKSAAAVWKIGALFLMAGGLLVAYWPFGRGDTS